MLRGHITPKQNGRLLKNKAYTARKAGSDVGSPAFRQRIPSSDVRAG